MEIIIGRDQNTRQLNINKDGQIKLYGQPGSVPMDVSRNHASLQPMGAGRWQIKNLNDSNVDSSEDTESAAEAAAHEEVKVQAEQPAETEETAAAQEETASDLRQFSGHFLRIWLWHR